MRFERNIWYHERRTVQVSIQRLGRGVNSYYDDDYIPISLTRPRAGLDYKYAIEFCRWWKEKGRTHAGKEKASLCSRALLALGVCPTPCPGWAGRLDNRCMHRAPWFPCPRTNSCRRRPPFSWRFPSPFLLFRKRIRSIVFGRRETRTVPRRWR